MANGADPQSAATTGVRPWGGASNLVSGLVVVAVVLIGWVLEVTGAAPPTAVLLGAAAGIGGRSPAVGRGVVVIAGAVLVWLAEVGWAGSSGDGAWRTALTLGLVLAAGIVVRAATNGTVPSWVVALGGAAALATAAGAGGAFGPPQLLATAAGLAGGLLPALLVQTVVAGRQAAARQAAASTDHRHPDDRHPDDRHPDDRHSDRPT